MAEQQLDIRLKAIDEASAVVKKVTKEMEDLTDQLRAQVRASEKAQSVSGRLQTSFKNVGLKLKRLGRRFNKTTQKMATMKNAMMGLAAVAALKVMKSAIDDAAAFEGKLASLGPDIKATETRLRELQAASEHLFSLESLASAEAKLKAMGVPLKLTPQLLKAVTASSARMGISTEHAMDSLATGLARNSKMILDNLGITYNATEVYSNYAASIGKTTKELTEEEKKLAVVGEAQRQLNSQNAEIPAATRASMQMNAKLADVMMKLKRITLKMIPAFTVLIDLLGTIADVVAVAIDKIAAVVEVAVSAIMKVKEIASDVIEFGGYVMDEVGNVVGFVADAGSELARVTGVSYAFDFIGLGGGDWAKELADQVKRMNEDIKAYELSAKDVTAQQFHLNREFEREVVLLRQLQEEYPKFLSFKQKAKILIQDAIDQERYLVQTIKQHAKWEQEAWEQATAGAEGFLFQLFEVGKTMDGLNQMLDRFMAGTGEFAKNEKGPKGATKKQIQLAKWLAEAKIQLATMVDKHEAKLFQFKISRIELEQKLEETKNKANRETIKGQIKLLGIEQQRYTLNYEMGQIAAEAKTEAVSVAESTGAAGVKAQEVVDTEKEKGIRKLKIQQMLTESELEKKLIGFKLKGDALRLQLAAETNKAKQEQIKTELELLDIAGKQVVLDEKRQNEAQKYFDLASALSASASAMGQFSQQTSQLMTMTGNLAGMIGQVTDGTMKESAAVEQGIGMIGTGVASFIEGEQEKAAVLALMETAQAFASFPNAAAMASHFAAAAMFGLVAGGVIGGGGKSAGGAAGEKAQREQDKRMREAGGAGGQAQVVVNYNSGIVMGGQQSIARAIAAANGSISKTGQMASAF